MLSMLNWKFRLNLLKDTADKKDQQCLFASEKLEIRQVSGEGRKVIPHKGGKNRPSTEVRNV